MPEIGDYIEFHDVGHTTKCAIMSIRSLQGVFLHFVFNNIVGHRVSSLQMWIQRTGCCDCIIYNITVHC